MSISRTISASSSGVTKSLSPLTDKVTSLLLYSTHFVSKCGFSGTMNFSTAKQCSEGGRREHLDVKSLLHHVGFWDPIQVVSLVESALVSKINYKNGIEMCLCKNTYETLYIHILLTHMSYKAKINYFGFSIF